MLEHIQYIQQFVKEFGNKVNKHNNCYEVVAQMTSNPKFGTADNGDKIVTGRKTFDDGYSVIACYGENGNPIVRLMTLCVYDKDKNIVESKVLTHEDLDVIINCL